MHAIFGQEFRNLRTNAVLFLDDPCHALCTVGFYVFRQGIQGFTGHLIAEPLCYDTADAAAALQCTLKHLKSAALYRIGKVGQFHVKTHIRLVRAETIHCLAVGETEERRLDIQV